MSRGARVDPQAVVKLAVDLQSHSRTAHETCASASATASRVAAEIAAIVDRRRGHVRQAEQDYRYCTARNLDDAVPDCTVEARALASAVDSLECAQNAMRRFSRAQEAFSQSTHTYRSTISACHDEARSKLTQIAQDLEIYERFSLTLGRTGASQSSYGLAGKGDGASGAGSATGDQASSTPAGDTAVIYPAGVPDGYGLIPLSRIVPDDSITGPESFKMDSPPGDLEWAFTALNNVVLPALALGKSAEYFADRDSREGRVGNRSYSATFSGFFGQDECPRFSIADNGRIDVANGRHRVWVASHLNLQHIPGFVINP